MDIKKALDTATGVAIIPERLQSELTELADEKSPLRQIFQRIPWSTNAYEWNARTALGSAGFYGQGDGYSESNSTIERRSVNIKMLKSEGAVSNLLQMASQDYINALQNEVVGAAKSLTHAIENAYINGDTGVSANQFDGLSVQITSEVDAEGAVLGFDILDEAIAAVRDAGGNPDLIVVSNREKAALDTLMRKTMNINWAKVDTQYGVRLQTYQDIPVLGSAFVTTTEDYGTTATGDYSEAYVLDTSEIVVPELLPITYEEVAVQTDAMAFRLKTYLALAIEAVEYQRKITNIAKP